MWEEQRGAVPACWWASWTNYGILLATRSGMLGDLNRRHGAGQDVFLDTRSGGGSRRRPGCALPGSRMHQSLHWGGSSSLILLEQRPLGTLQNDHDYFGPCPIGCLGSHHQKVERWRTIMALSLDRSYQDSIQTPRLPPSSQSCELPTATRLKAPSLPL